MSCSPKFKLINNNDGAVAYICVEREDTFSSLKKKYLKHIGLEGLDPGGLKFIYGGVEVNDDEKLDRYIKDGGSLLV